jgi:hypothetical protein
MKKLMLISMLFFVTVEVIGQAPMKSIRIGLITSYDKNLSAENVPFDRYSGYAADYNKVNYRIGLNFERELKSSFTLSGSINYSNKDFTGTYFCHVCNTDGFWSPEEIKLQIISIPVGIRYYLLPDKFKVFGEAGINNQFLLDGDLTGESYAMSAKIAAGIEYELSQKLALQFIVDYNKGVSSVFNESAYNLNYLGIGIGLMKRL